MKQVRKRSEFGKRLHSLRLSRGLTQTQLANAIGSSQRAISHYETVADYPPPAVIVDLAKALRVSTDELLAAKLIELGWLNVWQAKQLSEGRADFSLGIYRIVDYIGRGGMGEVYKAEHGVLGRVVAIKVMAAQLATNATARQRFLREARAAAAVSHDHIVTIHAVEEANGLPYLVMQYVAGVSLQQRIERSGHLQLHEILRIGMQTAPGLAAAGRGARQPAGAVHLGDSEAAAAGA